MTAEQADTLLLSAFPEDKILTDALKETGKDSAGLIKNLVKKKLLLPLKAEANEPLPSLQKFYGQLRGVFKRLAESAGETPLRDAALNAGETLRLSEQINITREYYQIPFLTREQDPARQAVIKIRECFASCIALAR